MDLTKEIHHLERADEILSWDQQTYMPPKGGSARASQLSTLAGIRHGMLTGEPMAELLSGLDESDKGGLSDDQRVNVREIRRLHERERKIPGELVKELSHLQSLSQQAWVEARRKDDFPSFAPWLEKILKVRIQIGDAIGYEDSRYDAFLDEFEPGASTAEIAAVFDNLKTQLVPLVREILEAGRRLGRKSLALSFPVAGQEVFVRTLTEAIGFDFDAGRLDVSAHPFTVGTAGDVRLTTRYDEDQPTFAIFGGLHEAGHGMYEQGYDPAHEGTPMGRSVSLGIHESQSRLWENLVGRSLQFWEHAFPVMREAMPDATAGLTLDAWHREVNRVEASLIRVEADEVTYNLHILLRFEIEKMMAEEAVAVADLPALWNDKFREYFGITPPDDASGVLQDIHWSMGAIGYFPTYALGNLYAAQLWQTARQVIPDMEEDFRKGRFAPLLDWLRTNIHRRGQTYPAHELVRVVTGKPLDAGYLMRYLQTKYRALYEL